MTESPPPLCMREVLGNVPLRKLTAAQLVSLFGDFLAIFAVFSVVSFKLHGSAAEVSGVMIAYMLPQALIGPLAGVFVDRWNVKITMITSDLLRAGLVTGLVYSSDIGQIYGLMILLSAISAFFMPAQTIAIRTIVPVHGLMAASAIMMQVTQVTQIVTPGIAGLLINRTGAAVCFWLDGASFLFSAGMVFTIPIQRMMVPAGKGVAAVMADLTFGARYIFHHKTLAFTILTMAAGGFAVSFYNALIPVYVRDVLHGSTGLFGVLATMAGAGMVAGTLVTTRLGALLGKEQLILTGLLAVALGFLLLTLSGGIALAVGATVEMGIGVALVIIPAQALLQGETPVELLGRVSGSVRSVVALVQTAGLALSGAIAEAIGIRACWLAVAVLLALLGLQVYSFSRSTLR